MFEKRVIVLHVHCFLLLKKAYKAETGFIIVEDAVVSSLSAHPADGIKQRRNIGLCHIMRIAHLVEVEIFKYGTEQDDTHPHAVFRLGVFHKKVHTIAGHIVINFCVITSVHGICGVVKSSIAKSHDFKTELLNPVAPFCVIPVEKVFGWHQSCLLNGFGANHHTAATDGITVYKIGDVFAVRRVCI